MLTWLALGFVFIGRTHTETLEMEVLQNPNTAEVEIGRWIPRAYWLASPASLRKLKSKYSE